MLWSCSEAPYNTFMLKHTACMHSIHSLIEYQVNFNVSFIMITIMKKYKSSIE